LNRKGKQNCAKRKLRGKRNIQRKNVEQIPNMNAKNQSPDGDHLELQVKGEISGVDTTGGGKQKRFVHDEKDRKGCRSSTNGRGRGPKTRGGGGGYVSKEGGGCGTFKKKRKRVASVTYVA